MNDAHRIGADAMIPFGQVRTCRKKRRKGTILLKVQVPDGCTGYIKAASGRQFEDGTKARPVRTEDLTLIPAQNKNKEDQRVILTE